ncbi:hypothetical protein LP089_07515 [Moraxella bovis]|uniref:hypothetical protein n=1 Tax=Moraxella bovis TaxID=476 RepID=UPI0022276CB3|nr:hypothetical protein [Moraxella bovis]UYZ69992.1 hypothetical protein LP089_07515 [Moraxella bovis]
MLHLVRFYQSTLWRYLGSFFTLQNFTKFINLAAEFEKRELRAVKKLLKKQGVISIDDYIALNPANMSLREVIDILRQNTNWTFGKTLQAGFRIMGEKK